MTLVSNSFIRTIIRIVNGTSVFFAGLLKVYSSVRSAGCNQCDVNMSSPFLFYSSQATVDSHKDVESVETESMQKSMLSGVYSTNMLYLIVSINKIILPSGVNNLRQYLINLFAIEIVL